MFKTKMVRIFSSTKDHTRRQTDSAEQMKHPIQYRMKKKSRRFGVVVKPIITLIIFAWIISHTTIACILPWSRRYRRFGFIHNKMLTSFHAQQWGWKKGIKQAKVNRWTVIHIGTWLSNFWKLVCKVTTSEFTSGMSVYICKQIKKWFKASALWWPYD